MKVTAVKPFPVYEGRNFLFVKVETDEGISGIGEAGITWRERAAAEAVNHLASFVVGQDPMRTEHLWQTMFRGGFFPAGRLICSALSAIDIALWDIKGKALDQPLWKLLGGHRDRVPTYASGSLRRGAFQDGKYCRCRIFLGADLFGERRLMHGQPVAGQRPPPCQSLGGTSML